MPVIGNQTNINAKEYFFLEVNSQLIKTSTIKANTGIFSTIFVQDARISSITGAVSVSTINLNYLSSGRAYISSLTGDVINVSTITSKYIELYKDPIPTNLPLWDSNTVYGINNYVSYSNIRYKSLRSNLNVNPSEPIQFWINNEPYKEYNYAFVAGVGTYICIADTPGSPYPPNSDYAFWVGAFGGNNQANVWEQIPTIYSGIEGDENSYINVGNANISTIKAFDISSLTGYISTINTDYLSSLTGYVSTFTTDRLSSLTGYISTFTTDNLSSLTGYISTLTTDRLSSLTGYVSTFTTDRLSSLTGYISTFTSDSGLFSNLVASNLVANVANISNLTATNINGQPVANYSASNWYNFPAQGNVTATLGLFGIPQYNISNFLNLTVGNSITAQGGSITAGINLGAGVSVGAPLGSFNTVNAESVQVSVTNETASVDIYGASLVAGNNALYVEGGTTLTGGGVIHGVTIGALQVAGIDTVRIDVLPAGMALNSATFITQNAVGAINIASGGALSLAGGSYIEYNTDENRFINTTSGNDFTDIYVGNIHGAFGGSAPLRINDAGRGVELANVNSMTMTTQLAGVLQWSPSTNYAVGNKVKFLNIYYNALVSNSNLQPNIPIPAFNSANSYNVNNIVFVSGSGSYRNIISVIPPVATPPNGSWSFVGATNAITQVWAVFNPYVATITGDDVSQITMGNVIATNITASNIIVPSIITPNINTSNLTVDTSAIINTQLYLRQNNTFSYVPTLIFENTTTATSATIDFTPNASLNFNSDDINISGNSNLALSANSNVYIASPNPIQVYSQIRLREYPVLNPNPTKLTFENESNTNSASIEFASAIDLLTIQASNLTFQGGLSASLTAPQTNILGQTNVGIFADRTINVVATSNVYMKGISSIVLESDDTLIYGLSNLALVSELGNVAVASVIQTGISGGLLVNIQSGCNIDIGATGNIFAQCDGELTLNSFSNTLITATGSIGIGAQGDAQLVSGTGRLILASGGSNNVEINAIGTGSIIANTFGTGGITLYNGSNNGIAINNTAVNLGSDGDIELTASNTIILNAPLVNILGSNTAIQSISTLRLSTGTLFADTASFQSISTLRFSTGTLFANSISSINIQASNIFTSTIRATNTMTASTIAIDRIVGNASATNIFTNNLFPLSAGAQVGFGATLAGGGYYNFGFHRSTFTTNINPATDGASTANNIKVTGHLSTVSLGVSTINFKAYPFVSTLNNSIITANATATSGTPALTRLQSNALRFPFPGTYKVFQEYAVSKGSGGGIHGSLIYASNGATTATVANATNWANMGMSSCPFQDTAGVSTITTAVTTILANSANLTRDLYFYDSGSGNVTVSFYINPPQITYIPSPGIAPDL